MRVGGFLSDMAFAAGIEHPAAFGLGLNFVAISHDDLL
jgi:hypothetical protein